MPVDYSTVTEVPGDKATREQLARMFHRYRFAVDFCEDKDVLEVACGAGQGLGYLARKARRVVGGDCTDKLVTSAKQYYKNRVELCFLDAQHIPFGDSSFDVVILFEAIYYLAQPKEFVNEVHRILRKEGVLLIAMVNKEWSEFNPSPFSTRYLSVPELHQLLMHNGYRAKFYGGFPAIPEDTKKKITAVIRRIAVKFHLIPKTMKGKELFKKVFYGKLLPLGPEIEEDMCEYVPPEPVSSDTMNSEYKVIYSVARV
jgi:ubiquinone/menaquinone biosynthesis C-methylase UbiE